MAVKLFGSAMLIISSLYYSYILIQKNNRRILQINSLCSLISYIKNNIDSFMRPIGEIIESFSGYDAALSDFIEVSRREGLAKAAEKCPLDIGDDAYNILMEFVSSAGSGYKDDEIRLCSYCYNGLSDILKREREDAKKKAKLYKTLPVMSAMSVVLILL